MDILLLGCHTCNFSFWNGFLGDMMLTPAQEKRIKKIQEENLKLLEMFNDFPYISNPVWKTTIEEGSYMHWVNISLGQV